MTELVPLPSSPAPSSDSHPSLEQARRLDTETGETGEQKLMQANGDAEQFYRQLEARATIKMESTGNCHWLAGHSNIKSVRTGH